MTTVIWTKTMTRFMKVRSLWAVVDAFEYGADHLLHDFIACGGYLLSDNNSSRYRRLELPIKKEIFSRCRKDIVTSASHYSWDRRKDMLSASLPVLSVSSY